MSDTANPYQSPETAPVPVTPLVAQGTLTENMLIYLKGASPWLRFLGILGFVFAGLTVILGLSFFANAHEMETALNGIPGFEMAASFAGAIFGGAMAVSWLGSGALLFFPALFMFKCGTKIRSYLRTGTEQDLEQALKNNKSLWKFIGIYCIVLLAIIPVLIVVMIIAVVFSAFT